MVKTNRNSRFVLLSLGEIRSSKEVILQAEDTNTTFDNGQKCYLCEVVNSFVYSSDRSERELIAEICTLNNDKRKLEKKIARLEKLLQANASK